MAAMRRRVLEPWAISTMADGSGAAEALTSRVSRVTVGRRTGREGWTPVAVAVVTLLVFSRSLGHGFVDWDDTRLIIGNLGYRGFGWAQLRWMSSSVLLGHYVPVTWLSFALDHAIWGLRPQGYHLTNVLLHAINAGLVCVLTTRLLWRATTWPAASRYVAGAAAALLWALHPLRVEAVSWVTGRRDVLSGMFLCLALGAWLRATEPNGSARRCWLGAAVGAYALALGSKSIVMMAPLAMVALDVYPLRRLPGDVRRWGAPTFRDVWLEKVPFVVLALLGAVASAIAVPQGIGYQILGLREWLGTLAVNLALPAWKTLLPLALSPLYEFPGRIDLTDSRYLGSALLVVVLTAGVVGLRRRWPGGLVAWLWYVAFLAPVSAIAHAGPQLTADRYSYLPTLGLSVLMGAALGAAASRARRRADASGRALGLGLLAIVLTLGSLTWKQQGAWRDTRSLWTQALSATPDCAVCHVNLGHMDLESGAPEAALRHFQQALALRPDRVAHHRGVGLALEALDRRDEAIDSYRRGLALVPGALSVRLSLASALLATGRLDEVIQTVDTAWRYYEPAALVPYFEDAVRHRPAGAVPRLGLVLAWLAAGQPDRARAEHDVLRRLHHDLAARVVAASGPW
jgi:hypothetical protein